MVGILAEKVKKHYKNNTDLIQTLIYGDSKQVGKSVYSLKTMFEIYQDWDEVFDHLFFKPINFVEYCRRLSEAHKKVPIIVWDDGGVHAGSDMYFKDRDLYFDLKNVIQTLGTVTQCLLVTSPSTSNPTDVLVEDRNVTVKIKKMDVHKRKAKIFAKSTLPWGKSLDRLSFFDEFDVMIDDDVYERYEEKRIELASNTMDSYVDNSDVEPDMMEIPDVDFDD